MDLMDRTCLKKMKAVQYKVIPLKLHWNIFKLHISEMISAKILPGSATSFAKSTIQPSYVNMGVWIQAFPSIFLKSIDITSK